MNRSCWISAVLGCMAAASTWAQDSAQCEQSDRYRIVMVAPGAEEVGTHFLIQRMSPETAAAPCSYAPQSGDFEIRNEDAEYFLGLHGDRLILDSGTGPEPRGLIIWDLQQRAKVYTDRYAEAQLDQGVLTYWLETGAGDDQRCPEAREWRAMGLGDGVAIETQVSLRLDDLTLTHSSHTRCAVRMEPVAP